MWQAARQSTAAAAAGTFIGRSVDGGTGPSKRAQRVKEAGRLPHPRGAPRAPAAPESRPASTGAARVAEREAALGRRRHARAPSSALCVERASREREACAKAVAQRGTGAL